MASLLTLTFSQPVHSLNKGDVLITEGQRGGDMFVLESGRLVIERGGVEIASIDEPGALIGEMSVLTGKPNSATVRADRPSQVRVVRDAIRYLERQPAIALHVASVLSHRLDDTSALLVELSREHEGKASEQGLVNRIFSTLLKPRSAQG